MREEREYMRQLKPGSHLRFERDSAATRPKFEPIRGGDRSPPRITAGSRSNRECVNRAYEATTSNEFVTVVTFSRQYILIGSYSHMIFYVACVLLLCVHCKKALTCHIL